MQDIWLVFEDLQPQYFQPEPWTWILEGLQLLDLLVRVNPNDGWSLVFDVANVDHVIAVNEAALFDRTKCLPRYTLELWDVNIEMNFQAVFQAVRRLIGADDHMWEPPTSDFERVRQLLLDEWTRQHHGTAFDRACEGRIEVNLALMISNDFQSDAVRVMVQQAQAVVRANDTSIMPVASRHPTVAGDGVDGSMMAVQNRFLRHRAAFCFVAVDMKLLGQALTNAIARALLHITKADQLPISCLRFEHLQIPQLASSVSGTFFSDIVGSASTRRRMGLKDLAIVTGRFDQAAVGAVCTAVAQSQCLRSFSLARWSGGEYNDDGDPSALVERSVWWPWLAYALFNLDTTHNIESVELDADGLELEQVWMMREVLDHPNPLAFVCAMDEPEPKAPYW